MTNDSPQEMLAAEDFYDVLANDYDQMTGFEQRFVKERPFFRVIVERYKIRTALDAGCGTGFHSFLLAQLGVRVTAVDISAEMLKKVREHSEKLQLRVKTVQVNFQHLTSSIKERFDLVLSLGNSLAHLLSAEDLQKTLGQFSACTRPGGVLLLQNLNYDRIMANRERIQNVKENGAKTFTRFYEYSGDTVLFSILIEESNKGSIFKKKKTVQLRPIFEKDLKSVLATAGFESIQLFGGISLREYDRNESKDLVVIARRREV